MTFRFLVDECLSPHLVAMAVAAGHVESTCVRDRGLAGSKDWRLIDYVVAGDFTLARTSMEQVMTSMTKRDARRVSR